MMVPRYWHQHFDTPTNGALERRSLSKIWEGAQGAAGPQPVIAGGSSTISIKHFHCFGEYDIVVAGG